MHVGGQEYMGISGLYSQFFHNTEPEKKKKSLKINKAYKDTFTQEQTDMHAKALNIHAVGPGGVA